MGNKTLQATSLRRRHTNLVMISHWLEPRKQGFGLRLEHCHIVIRPGKFMNGLKRIENVDHEKLRFGRPIVSEDVTPAISRNLTQTWQDFALEQSFISICILQLRP